MRRISIHLPGFRFEMCGPLLSACIFGLTIERVDRIMAIGGCSFILPDFRRA